jgi:hypothetical protein
VRRLEDGGALRQSAPCWLCVLIGARKRTSGERNRPGWWPSQSLVAALAASAVPVGADAQNTCPLSPLFPGANFVTLSAGSCAVTPNTTLQGNGGPGNAADNATNGAQITTNNETINLINGGTVGGFACTAGVITFSSGSSIGGNWTTAASAQAGGMIIFQQGSVINPSTGNGVDGLLANATGSAIIATGLTRR